MRRARALPVLLTLVLLGGGGPAFAAADPVAADSTVSVAPLFSRRDLALGALAAGATAIVAAHDLDIRERVRGRGSRPAHDLARVGDALGHPALVGPALLAADGFARFTNRPAAAAAIERVAFSAAVAGVTTLAIKEVVGRWRPDESPADAARFTPFSRHDAFPSGHSTMAFAVASALDAETRSPLVRWTAYPLATLVAWARLHDDRHWASDVVAGAAVGAWTARKADTMARRRFPRGLWVIVYPQRGGAAGRLRTTF